MFLFQLKKDDLHMFIDEHAEWLEENGFTNFWSADKDILIERIIKQSIYYRYYICFRNWDRGGKFLYG